MVSPSHLLTLFMWQSIKFPTANKQIRLEDLRASYVHRIRQHKPDYTFQHAIQYNTVVISLYPYYNRSFKISRS